MSRTRCPSMSAKIQIVFLNLALIFYSSNCKVYYITPELYNQRITWLCRVNSTCFILSQFAYEYSIQHLDSSISLVFLPGQHYLKSQLNVINTWNFEMVSNSSDVVIGCDKLSRFSWSGVQRVLISDIKFRGCGLINAHSVKQFEIINSTFIEIVDGYAALIFVHSNVTITKSWFTVGSTQHPKPEMHFSLQAKSRANLSTDVDVGGTITATDKSIVIITESRFEGISAQLKGVIFAELYSKLIIANVTVIGTGFGNIASGAIIFAETGSVVMINNTVISNYRAMNSRGVVFLHNTSFITHRCVCRNNFAREGGVIFAYKSLLTITESTFTGNYAVENGGVLLLKHSIANISNSVFTHNTAYNGGGIYSGYYSSVTIDRSNFTFNQANGDAGAISGHHSMLTVLQVKFSGNTARWAGAVAAYENAEITIKQCKFHHNKAKWGGALALYKGTMSVINSILFYQHVTHQGGVAYINAGILMVESSSMDYNEADLDGGVIIGVNSKLVINGTNFTNNYAKYCGSVIHWSQGAVTGYGDLLFELNIAEKGMIYLDDTSANFVGNLSFTHNHALLYIINSHVRFSGLMTFPVLEIHSGRNKEMMTKIEVNDGHEIEKLNDLIQSLQSIGDWRGLCRNLDVDESIMDHLEHSYYHPDVQKAECLKVYFNTGKARWTKVVEAVAMYPIKNLRVAKKILEEHGLPHDEL